MPAAEKLEAEENCKAMARITADSTFKPKPLVHKSLNQSLAIELVTKKTDNEQAMANNKFNAVTDPHKHLKKISALRVAPEAAAAAAAEQTNNKMFKVKLRPSRPSLGHWGGAKKAKTHHNEQ